MNRILIILFALLSTALAVEPPGLRRLEAQRILEAMEWRDVTIVTIQQGVNSKGTAAPIYATIAAFGKRDNRNQQIIQNVSYDEEYGWFFHELTEKGARLWTKDGYKEIKVFGTW